MKRLWNDLGALLPASFIGAHIEDTTGTVAEDDPQPMRSPKKETTDEGGEEQPEAESKPEASGFRAPAKSSAEAPADSTEASPGSAPSDGGSSGAPSSSPIALPQVDNPDYSMYTPTTVELTVNLSGGGGSAGTTTVTPVAAADGQLQPTPVVGDDLEPTSDTGPLPLDPPVEPVNDEGVLVDSGSDPPAGGNEDDPQSSGGGQPASGNGEGPEDADSMIVLLGGTASSFGANGITSGDIDLEVIDYGAVTVAYGQATFMSTSTGEDGEDGSADTFVDVLGADLVFAHEFNYDYAIGTGPDAVYTDYSKTLIIAIDFEGVSGDGLALAGNTGSGPFAGFADLPPALLALLDTESGENVDVDGNTALLGFDLVGDGDVEDATVVASTSSLENNGSSVDLQAAWADAGLSVNVDAIGVETIASFDGSLLEVEDQFSSVGGLVIAAA